MQEKQLTEEQRASIQTNLKAGMRILTGKTMEMLLEEIVQPPRCWFWTHPKRYVPLPCCGRHQPVSCSPWASLPKPGSASYASS